jgi:hypothetical protein
MQTCHCQAGKGAKGEAAAEEQRLCALPVALLTGPVCCVQVMYAVTDGFSGLNGGWDTPGTGMNFLVHNMCRLPGSGGTWMVVEGGMGSVTQQLAASALRHGARIHTGAWDGAGEHVAREACEGRGRPLFQAGSLPYGIPPDACFLALLALRSLPGMIAPPNLLKAAHRRELQMGVPCCCCSLPPPAR